MTTTANSKSVRRPNALRFGWSAGSLRPQSAALLSQVIQAAALLVIYVDEQDIPAMGPEVNEALEDAYAALDSLLDRYAVRNEDDDAESDA